MAFYKVDKKKFERMRREAQQFQDDIVCAVGTDFMQNIAEAENRMIFDILNGVENEATAKVEEVRHAEWIEHKPNTEQMKEFHDMGIGKAMALKSIYWTCSSCGAWGTPRYKYCPECGAEMDGAKMSESPTGSERSD